MHPDANFPGQHWSEMLPEYEILMYSISGASNGIITHQFYKGLELEPDAVVLGFTEPNRLEFRYNESWITGCHQGILTTEQKLLAELYKVHACSDMLMTKDCTMVRGLLCTLQHKQIPYAWTLNLLFNNLWYLPYPSNPTVNQILESHFSNMIPTNLATYQGWKISPGFHTDDPEWQKRFAQEVRQILAKQVDF